MNWFQGSKSEFNLDLLDFFTFIKLLSYLIGIPFIEISRFSNLEFLGNKFRGWPKNFRNFAAGKKSWYSRELNFAI